MPTQTDVVGQEDMDRFPRLHAFDSLYRDCLSLSEKNSAAEKEKDQYECHQ